MILSLNILQSLNFLVKFKNQRTTQIILVKKMYVAFFFLLLDFYSKHCLNKNKVNSNKWA